MEDILDREYQALEVLIPYADASLLDLFHRRGRVEEERFTAEGTWVKGRLPKRFAARFQALQVRRQRLGKLVR